MKQFEGNVIRLVVLIALVLAGAVLWNLREQQRRDEARKLVDAIVGRYPDRLKGDESGTRDPWGRLLQIERQGGLSETYVATSAGPDGRFATRDDISARNHGPVDLGRAGEAFGRGLGKFGAGAARGLYNSAREQIRGK